MTQLYQDFLRGHWRMNLSADGHCYAGVVITKTGHLVKRVYFGTSDGDALVGKYRKYTPETKVRIVLEILRGDKSLAQASRDYGIKSSLRYRWKDQFQEGAKQSFAYGQAAEQKRRADKGTEL